MGLEENRSVGGVSLREYIELLVDARTETIKVQLAERLAAVVLAAEQHKSDHRTIEKDMEHLNQLRQEVTQDRERLTPLSTFHAYRDGLDKIVGKVGTDLSSLRGQMIGAGFMLTLAFAVIQIVIGFYR